MRSEVNFINSLTSGGFEWVNLINPTHQEVETLCKAHDLEYETVITALDEEERSRVQIEDNFTMIIVDVPVSFESDTYYSTVPLGIVKTDRMLLTLCTQELNVFSKRLKVTTTSINAHIYQILYTISIQYLGYLRVIERKSSQVERALRHSPQNEDLIEMLDLQKSLVYMSSSLRSNQIVLERLVKLEKNDTPEAEMLEDVIIENKQAIDMSKIYGNILSSNLNVFKTIISNNLNMVMKFLTVVSVIIAVPTVVSSFWGMNVPVPFQENKYGFLIVSIISVIITILAGLYINRKENRRYKNK